MQHLATHRVTYITPQLTLSEIEFADNSALPKKDTIVASSRITNLNEKTKEQASQFQNKKLQKQTYEIFQQS